MKILIIYPFQASLRLAGATFTGSLPGEIQIIDEASHSGARYSAQSFIFVKDGFSTL